MTAFSSRRPLVVGNWKMNLTRAEGAMLVESFVKLLDSQDEVEVGVAPGFIALQSIAGLLDKTHVALGAQNVFWKESGAFTGLVSAGMLADVGVRFCLVGHSETRGKFGKLEVPESTVPFFAETDETINLKIQTLLFHQITPILCVGETLQERVAGQTDEVIATQLAGALAGLVPEEFLHGVVAYEPVWAIGTGLTCDSAEANRVCGVVRQTLSNLMSPAVADNVRVLYGGSVKPSNAHELFSQPEIDGGLVGGASLVAEDFARIVLSARK